MLPPLFITAIGIAAAILTTGAWFPQVAKTLKSGNARDFSWAYLTTFSAGVSLWAVYGFLRNDIAVILANVVTLVLVLIVVLVKIRQR